MKYISKIPYRCHCGNSISREVGLVNNTCRCGFPIPYNKLVEWNTVLDKKPENKVYRRYNDIYYPFTMLLSPYWILFPSEHDKRPGGNHIANGHLLMFYIFIPPLYPIVSLIDIIISPITFYYMIQNKRRNIELKREYDEHDNELLNSNYIEIS